MAYSCLLNGSITSLDQARLPLTDLGILRGYGFSEYIRTYNGIPFLLGQHLERLEASSRVVRLPLPYTLKQIEEWVRILVEKNAFDESHIKIIVTGGPSEDGMAVTTPSFFILVTPLTPFKETFYTLGVRVMTHELLREFPEAKGLNYMTTIALREEKRERGVFEVIYTADNCVLEASTSNLFIVKDDHIITPKDHVLKGITRNLIIQLAKKNWNVEERSISLSEFARSQEIFITGSYKEIMPVIQVDTHTVGYGKPGEITKKLYAMYKEYVSDWVRNNIYLKEL